jgi:hypothetical protein
VAWSGTAGECKLSDCGASPPGWLADPIRTVPREAILI